MYYIIDGYNVFFQISEKDPSPSNREDFVLSIAIAMKKARIEGEMIFDTPIHHETLYAHSIEKPPLTLTLAPHGLEADDLIVEKFYALKNSKNYTVVTSDKNLKMRLQELDVKVITVNAFMSLLSKKRKEKTLKQNPSNSSLKELKRYENIFLKKLEDEND